jgi:thioredoxin reductase (NADPH)
VADICGDLEKLADQERDPVKPGGQGCKECLEAGAEWVHLRLCMSCGHVGCCDSSPNKHATKHFHRSHHPVIRSFEPDEDWAYCYVDDLMIEGIAALPGESAAHHYSAPPAQHP